MGDETIILLIKQMERANVIRFANLETQWADRHKENIANFAGMENRLTTLTTAFDQARGGIKVLYWLGGLVGAAASIAAIFEAWWHWKHS